MKRILWIEDNVEVYEDRLREMQYRGWSVDISAHIEHFKRNFLENLSDYDAIILDVLFDDVEYQSRYLGLDILRLIRQKVLNVPVVLWTVVGEQARDEIDAACGVDPNTRTIVRHKFEDLVEYIENLARASS